MTKTQRKGRRKSIANTGVEAQGEDKSGWKAGRERERLEEWPTVVWSRISGWRGRRSRKGEAKAHMGPLVLL